MHPIALDQNALSMAALAKSGSLWAKVRQLLVDGVEQAKLTCPLPYETIAETAALHGNRAKDRLKIGRLADYLSGGRGFLEHRLIAAKELLALVRFAADIHPYRLIPSGWYLDEKLMKEERDSHREYLAGMSANQAAFVTDPKRPTKRKPVFDSIALGRNAALWRDLELYIAGRRDGFECASIMQHFVWWSMTASEALALREAIRHHRFTAIPVNAMHLTLGTCWEQDLMGPKPRKYSASDEIDIARCCVGLAYCGTVVTERYVKTLCQRASSIINPVAAVFSVAEVDDFIEHLKQI